MMEGQKQYWKERGGRPQLWEGRVECEGHRWGGNKDKRKQRGMSGRKKGQGETFTVIQRQEHITSIQNIQLHHMYHREDGLWWKRSALNQLNGSLLPGIMGKKKKTHTRRRQPTFSSSVLLSALGLKKEASVMISSPGSSADH